MAYKITQYHRLRRLIFAIFLVSLLPKCNGFAINHAIDKTLLTTLSRIVETTCLTFAILASTCTDARAATISDEINVIEQKTWQLSNGLVELSNPLTSFSSYELTNPILLGAGGGGAVFATHPMNDPNTNINNDVAVKISWTRSASSVEHECKVLQEMEAKRTRNVERCLGMKAYPPDSNRVMIALQPVVENAVSRVDKINPNVQPVAVQGIIQTLIDMLHDV